MKKLRLNKETLSDLTTADLRDVIGGRDSQTCPITYGCVSNTSCNISNEGCNIDINISNACTFVPGGFC